MKIHFHIAKNKKAKVVANELLNLYGQVEPSNAEVIVAVGGDGAMLAAMRESITFNIPVFGLNRGNIGFLMNDFHKLNLIERLKDANEIMNFDCSIMNFLGYVSAYFSIFLKLFMIDLTKKIHIFPN